MGPAAPLARDLLHADDRGRGHRRLLQARPQRGSRLHRQDHGGGRLLAGRHGRGHNRADHRPPGAQAAGDAEPRLREELHQRRPRHHLRQPEGLDPAGRRAGHLVPGSQEGARHRRHAAAGRHRPRLQRRVRRHLRHRLRLHGQWLQRARAARPGARHPQAAPRAAGHLQDRHPGRPGRARVRRVLAREARRAGHRPLRADRRAQEPERRHAGGRGADRPTRRSWCASPVPSAPSRTFSASTSSPAAA